jgi:hypothetical protein
MDPGLTAEVFLSGKCPKMQSVSALECQNEVRPRPDRRGNVIEFEKFDVV